MRRTDLMDTPIEVHRFIVEKLRRLSPEERAKLLIETIHAGWEIERAVRKQGLKPDGHAPRSA
jgi:hypothetical protein